MPISDEVAAKLLKPAAPPPAWRTMSDELYQRFMNHGTVDDSFEIRQVVYLDDKGLLIRDAYLVECNAVEGWARAYVRNPKYRPHTPTEKWNRYVHNRHLYNDEGPVLERITGTFYILVDESVLSLRSKLATAVFPFDRDTLYCGLGDPAFGRVEVHYQEKLDPSPWIEVNVMQCWGRRWAVDDDTENYLLNDDGTPKIEKVYGQFQLKRRMT